MLYFRMIGGRDLFGVPTAKNDRLCLREGLLLAFQQRKLKRCAGAVVGVVGYSP